MELVNLDPTMESWLGTLRVKSSTLEDYRQDFLSFCTWCADNAIEPMYADNGDLHRYVLHLSQSGRSTSTCNRRLAVVHRWYAWLFAEGTLTKNPALGIRRSFGADEVGEVLSIHDLRAFLAAAQSAEEMSLCGLMAVCGLNAAEIASLRVQDIVELDGVRHARFRSVRTGRTTEVPLPWFVAEAVQAVIGERIRGPLLFNQVGKPMDRAAARRLVIKIADRARLGVAVSPQLLLTSCRVLLMIENVPMQEYYIANGWGKNSAIGSRLDSLPPPKQHVALRLAGLLRPDGDSTLARFDAADSVCSDQRLPRAAQIMLYGAAFEDHLRKLARRADLLGDAYQETTIGSLAGQLTGKKVLSPQESQVASMVMKARNYASHGWYDLVTDELADTAVATMRQIVRDHPL